MSWLLGICSMRSKWRHRAGQPPFYDCVGPIEMLDVLHEVLSR